LRDELSFRVLGGLEVWRDGQLLPLGAAKQRALLGLLVIRRGEVGRDVLVEALWGEQPPRGARNTLQVYVSRLRKALGSDVIVTTPSGYRIQPAVGTVDAERFESLLREGSDRLSAGDPRAASSLLSEALALWRGPAFADLRYEAFAQVESGRLDELRLACVEERFESELQLGRHAELVGELEAWVIEQPLRERLRGQLILALYRSGRQSEALAQYQATRRMLADELGLEPSPELRELERMILAHDPGLAAPTTPGPQRSNLPLQPTPFIGRVEELAAVMELVRSGGRRLVTLTGAGGSGKTRLAIEVAAELGAEYADGVWWVPLQSVADHELVRPTIATAIDAGGDLVRDIGDRHMLLLLDNFEQLLDAGPDTAGLLSRCRNLTLLVTSRERLHVAAEREYNVLPMTETDAVALFDERAVGRGEAATVAEICRRVDCLPLGVELAAAHTRTLPPEQILRRLDERLSFLTGGPRDVPARQQTLRATLEWSYNLLTEDDQELFALLSVFPEVGDLQAIEAVSPNVRSGSLSSLVQKSLVRTDVSGGELRYSMLRTVRDYALTKLEAAGDLPAARRRHAEYFRLLVERALRARTGKLLGVDDEPDLRVVHELANVREALAFALAEGDLELALELAGMGARGWTAWAEGGATIEGGVLVRTVLDRTEHLQTPARAQALATLGAIELALGRVRASRELMEQACALYEALGDEEGTILPILSLFRCALLEGDSERAQALLERARAVEGRGNDFLRAQILFAAAEVEGNRGAVEEADRLLEQGLELVRSRGVPRRLWRWVLNNIAWSAILREDFARARAALEESLSELRLSKIAVLPLAVTHANLGLVSLFEHDLEGATDNFRQVLTLLREVPANLSVFEALHGLAGVAALGGDPGRAVTIWSYANTLVEDLGFSLALPDKRIVERYLEPARASLGDNLSATAWAEGASMTRDEAIAYALRESG
jgi:predicted ATPase/DNA-binding SARP family transcriptional activator